MQRAKNGHSKLRIAPSEAGDELGAYTLERLLEMDRRFRERLARAFQTGSESRQSAAMNGASASRPR
jgi:hypothetical protein